MGNGGSDNDGVYSIERVGEGCAKARAAASRGETEV